MTIVALTDIHAGTKAVSAMAGKLAAADLLLLCGDITHFGHRKEMAAILDLIRAINPSVLAVSGNCDHPDAEAWLAEQGLSLNGISTEFRGLTLLGLSGSLPCPGKTPQEYEEAEFDALLSGIQIPQKGPFILVSHQPPFGTLNDEVSPGQHVGSRAVLQFIERTTPVVCFTGHIHEGTGIDHIGPTAVVNPGPAGKGNCAIAEIAGGILKNLEIIHVL